ncbi:hypothetical protein TNCV_1695631 [Trichonephila clavipes]|nr:hypothetical protein TNCV_1695631 [Trichonephila clavipes]
MSPNIVTNGFRIECLMATRIDSPCEDSERHSHALSHWSNQVACTYVTSCYTHASLLTKSLPTNIQQPRGKMLHVNSTLAFFDSKGIYYQQRRCISGQTITGELESGQNTTQCRGHCWVARSVVAGCGIDSKKREMLDVRPGAGRPCHYIQDYDRCNYTVNSSRRNRTEKC